MRLGAALGLGLALLSAGCGGAHRAATTTAATTTAATPSTTVRTLSAPTGLRVGVVGPLALEERGIVAERGTLAQVGSAPLVLVSAEAADLASVARAARAHPASHFALVGASTKGDRARNLVGIVLRDDQAAFLAGIVAGSAAAVAGGTAPRVAWVGPQERRLARAYARGVHRAMPGASVLDAWSSSVPARCKEAALAAMGRGAMVVMAHRGLCADAVIAAAHEQNHPGLRLGQFEFPEIAANVVARDAVAGIFYGGEDIVFGAANGTIGVGALDPRISSTTLIRARSEAEDLASGLGTTG